MSGGGWLAIDVGGANLKAAHGSGPARSVPFELWKPPDALPGALAAIAASLPTAGQVALTMTAELCDCFDTKAEGVRSVLEAATRALGGRTIRVWGTDGRFHSVADVRDDPEVAAASNWLALATVAARLVPEGPGLLIDVGTTTADLIPIRDGRPAARGRTDTERLANGELIYAGVRRTPVFALVTELPFRGEPTGLAAEIFASTLDVFLLLGAIAEDPADRSTADGRPRTVAAAHARMARMVCGDRSGVTLDEARGLAAAAESALLDRLVVAADRACGPTVGRPEAAIVAGSGAFLARSLAARLVGPDRPIVDLNEAWGPAASSAACAHALAVLAGEEDAR